MFFFYIQFFLTVASSSDVFLSDEARLYKTLTSTYEQWNPDRSLRPVYNTSETLYVMFGLALIRVITFDDDTDIAALQTWERYVSAAV